MKYLVYKLALFVGALLFTGSLWAQIDKNINEQVTGEPEHLSKLAKQFHEQQLGKPVTSITIHSNGGGEPSPTAIRERFFTGATGGDNFGNSVSNAGDVNGDGYTDLIVGAPFNDAGGNGAGRAYIYFGGPSMDYVADVILTGVAAGDNFGTSVSAAGDVNGDGYSDVMVGAPYNDEVGNNAGKAYIYFGGSSMDNIFDVTLYFSSGYFGSSVASAGDINGDGYGDVIVGAPNYGQAFIYFGGPTMYNVPDPALSPPPDIVLDGIGSDFGCSVSSAGDVNNDGYSDVIVGASVAGGNGTGRAYIYFGGASIDNIPDIIFTGAGANDNFGISVSEAGDVNGDGYGDVIVGAWSYPNMASVGRAYIYYGGRSMDNTADVIFTGTAPMDNLGTSVSSAGDVNGDGYSDVIVGSPYNSAGGLYAGRAYVYFGGASMNNAADIILTGAAGNDIFGNSVSDAGDVNGDGYSDVIVGAPWNDVGGTNAGRAYLYLNSLTGIDIPDEVFSGTMPYDQFGISVSSAGDVNGDGYGDAIVGSYINTYIYFGGNSIDPVADVTMTYPQSGSSVSSAGDVNGDGYSDVIVGARDMNSWLPKNTGLSSMTVYAFATTSALGVTRIFAGTSGGVFVSTDNGSNWTPRNSGLTNTDVRSLYVKDNYIFAGTFGGGIFRCNVFSGWTAVNTGLTNMNAFTITGTVTNLYAGTYGGGVFSSINNGNNWSPVNAMQNNYVYSLTVSGTDLLAGTAGGVCFSPDGGASWAIKNSGLTNTDVRTITVSTSGTLYAGTWGGGVFTSPNNGTNWYPASTGLTNTYVRSLVLSGTKLFAGTAGGFFSIYGSISGYNWTDESAGLTPTYVNVLTFVGTDLFAGTNGGGVFLFGGGKVMIFYGGQSMNNSPDVTFVGERTNDEFGISVSTAGDVNGDGFSDVIVGSSEGKVYIYFGGPSMDNIADFKFYGQPGDWFGRSVSCAGDVNGDGYGDVVIGAPNSFISGSKFGRAYVHFGGLSMVNSPPFILEGGTAGNNFGSSVAGAGDVNGDGYADIIIGASNIFSSQTDPGAAYVFYGGMRMDLVADIVMSGTLTNEYYGSSVSSAGDINRDGYSDVVVGAQGNSAAGNNAGAAFVYFGGQDMDNLPDIMMTGSGDENWFGQSVSSVGDMNGDGYSDLIIGAWTGPTNYVESGSACVYLSSSPPIVPRIAEVKDVPYDQGDKVTVRWIRSGYDAGGIAKITDYVVQRSLPSGITGFGWENLAVLAATQDPVYSYSASTLYDSMSNTSGTFYFRVIARTSNPLELWKSAPVAGHSVDNISPSPATSLSANVIGSSTASLAVKVTTGSVVKLTWNKNKVDPDVGFYEFHRSRVSGFTPSETTKIGRTTDTTCTDTTPVSGNMNYYKVVTVDIHGNKSTPSPEAAASLQITREYTAIDSWNMISVPLTVDDYTKSVLFPTAISNAFAHQGGYTISSTLGNGIGYWLKFSGTHTLSMTGLERTEQTIAVKSGWNMIGSISSSVPVNTITSDPPGIVTSVFFGYNVGYHASITIEPSKAYWVKVNQEGQLLLSSSSSVTAKNRISIVPTSELPPSAPGGELSNLKSQIPNEFALEQNYPNPFNPVTKIQFDLPKSIFVSLKVYSVLGEEVATLLDDKREAGRYDMEFDGSKLPSGVYFYRLTAGSYVDTKKLLLVR